MASSGSFDTPWPGGCVHSTPTTDLPFLYYSIPDTPSSTSTHKGNAHKLQLDLARIKGVISVKMEIPRDFYRTHRHELVRYTTAEAYDGIVFLTFVRGRKQITIQFKEEEFGTSNVFTMIQEIQNYYRLIDWSDGAGNWCYMNRSKKRRDLRFIQRHKEVTKLKEQPWARVVFESEIEYEEIGPLEYRFGKWKGREVDVYRVWMDRDMHFLDRAMKAYRRLQGMNLTYDVLGHVADDDGNIVGIMTEPMLGRRIELHDAKLMYDSMQKLSEIGWILDAPHDGSVLVTDAGELRITAVHNVLELSKDPKEREKQIKRREAFCFEYVFMGMKNQCPSQRIPSATRGKLIYGVKVMVPQSDPERILKGSTDWIVEKFVDQFVANAVEILKLVRSGGVKRLLEADSSDEEGESRIWTGNRRHRPTKKLRSHVHARQRPPLKPSWFTRYETPLPTLPVAEDDLPLMPPPITDVRGSNVLHAPPSPPTISPRVSNVPSWIRDGPWLELATSSRFEVVES